MSAEGSVEVSSKSTAIFSLPSERLWAVSEAAGEIEAVFVESRITPAPEMVAPSSTIRLGSLSPSVLVRATAVLASELTRTTAPWPAVEIFEEGIAGDPVELKEEPSWSVSEDLEARMRSEPLSEPLSAMESANTSTTVPVVVLRRMPPIRRLAAPQELRRVESSTTPPSSSLADIPIVIALVELMSILAPSPPLLWVKTFPRSPSEVIP